MSSRLDDLRAIIDRADQAYYYGGDADVAISDDLYDSLKEELRQLCPDDDRLRRVGAVVPPDRRLSRVRHPQPMCSLAKCDDRDDFRRWHDSLGQLPLSVAHKLDGASLALYYRGGRLVQAVTRGGDDGYGEDVTHNAIRMAGVPATVPVAFNFCVRGEAILTVENWQRIDPERESNPRNLGNGILGRQDGENANLLTFYAFGLSDRLALASEDDVARYLGELGFTVVPCWPAASLAEALGRYDAIAAERDRLPYWIDGVVFKVNDLEYQESLGVSSGRPRGQRVLKFPAEEAQTVVEGVELTVGHTGAIIPTARLRPVRLGGTTVSNALLNNFQEIRVLDVAVGDTVVVVKAKDIIPKVIRVVERPAGRQPIVEPTTCPACGGPAGRRLNLGSKAGAVTECQNPACGARNLAKLKTWINKTGILGIGDAILAALVQSGLVQAPDDLYRVEGLEQKMASVVAGKSCIGAARAKTIYAEVAKTRRLPINIFMGALGIRHLGRRRVELIRREFPGEFDTVADWLSGRLRGKTSLITNIAGEIQDDIDAHALLIRSLASAIDVYADAAPAATNGQADAKTGPLAGKVFCFTGKVEATDANGDRYTRVRLHSLVQEHGGGVADDVRAGVTHLVQADPSSQSSKTKKAQKLGVAIISERAFLEMVEV